MSFDSIVIILFIILSILLFVLLSPGLIITFPGNDKWIEFNSMKTNYYAIAVHTGMFIVIMGSLIGIYFGLVRPLVVKN